MKQTIRKISLIAAAILAITAAAAAFAESSEPSVVPESAETVSGTAAEDSAAEEKTDVPETAQENDSEKLLEAMNAYRAARQTERLSNLEKELAEYVSSGSMTQEQADLILKYAQENSEARAQKSGKASGGRRGSRQNPFMNGNETGGTDGQTPSSGTVQDGTANPGMQQFPYGRQSRSGRYGNGQQFPSGTSNGFMPNIPGTNGIFH